MCIQNEIQPNQKKNYHIVQMFTQRNAIDTVHTQINIDLTPQKIRKVTLKSNKFIKLMTCTSTCLENGTVCTINCGFSDEY